jgi:protein TonB
MSYKALLFCPDEAAARLVTQVLSELEFTVELSFEPFVTVKKLSEEHYDALVVDCIDEQNASVLFKGARNSELNHSSLCVAVVDGQAGLAKAFKIGANLVLTKPINVEQSKNTLRVARGLLRKNGSAAPGTPTPHPQPASTPSHSEPALPERSHAASAALSSASPDRPTMPSTLLEAQQEKTPAVSARDTGAHQSKTEISEKSVAQSHFLGFTSSSTPVAGHAGSAAAPARAPERPSQPHAAPQEPKSITEVKSAAPLATHEPIQSTYTPPPAPLPVEVTPYPLPSIHTKSSSSKAPWIAIVLLIAGAAGYFGWKKFQPLQYLRSKAPVSAKEPASSEQALPTADTKPSPDISAPTAEPLTSSPSGASSTPTAVSNTASATNLIANSAPEGFPTKETIDVSTPAETSEPAITVVAKPEPIQVKQKPANSSPNQQSASMPAPPSLALPGANSSDSAIAGIVATNVVVPKPGGTLQISQGITQGLLIKKVPPSYPLTALQLRKQGTVQLMATISKTGAISKVRVLGGDPTLARAAVDAVKQWKYRPYLLNNEPVEIETQITINFRLPN